MPGIPVIPVIPVIPGIPVMQRIPDIPCVPGFAGVPVKTLTAVALACNQSPALQQVGNIGFLSAELPVHVHRVAGTSP